MYALNVDKGIKCSLHVDRENIYSLHEDKGSTSIDVCLDISTYWKYVAQCGLSQCNLPHFQRHLYQQSRFLRLIPGFSVLLAPLTKKNTADKINGIKWNCIFLFFSGLVYDHCKANGWPLAWSMLEDKKAWQVFSLIFPHYSSHLLINLFAFFAGFCLVCSGKFSKCST